MTLPIYESQVKKFFPIYTLYILFAIVHLLWSFTSQQSLENSYILTIFYISSGIFYHKKLSKIQLSDQLIPKIFSAWVIAWIIIKSLSFSPGELPLITLVIPPIFWLGLVIIISGVQKIYQFWRFLVGVTYFCWISPYLASYSFRHPPSLITDLSAQLSSYALWYLGWPARSHARYIIVNDNIVEVGAACTAIPIYVVFLSLLLILALYFPQFIQNLTLATIVGLSVGFILSIIRIMIMTIVVKDQPLFDFWHGGTGSNIFTFVGLLLFGAYLFWQIPTNSAKLMPDPVLNPPQAPISRPSLTTTLALWALIGLLGTSLLVRQGGAKPFANFAFPETIPLSGWKLIEIQELAPLAEMQIASEVSAAEDAEIPLSPDAILALRKSQQGSELFLSGRRYRYENRQNLENLTATFRYVVNVDPNSNLSLYYQRRELNQFRDLQPLDKTLANSSAILSFEDTNSLTYAACLTPEKTIKIQSDNELTRNYTTPQLLRFKLRNLLPWLKGQKLLQDDRCLWMELTLSSTESNPSSNLEPIWEFFQNYWGQYYPLP